MGGTARMCRSWRNSPNCWPSKGQGILTHIEDVSAIHLLHKLKSLHISTYCSTEIRFSEFPALEDCSLEWGRRRTDSLFDSKTLKKLFVNRYGGKDTGSFSKLINLESLAILNSPVANLRGLSRLSKLRSLRLALLKRLTSLVGISDLSQLEELNIDTCRGLRSIEEIGHLTHLRKFFLDNCGQIESLKPLNNLGHLEWVGFVESTDIADGDLSPLVRQKELERISFQNRRHYSHRREDFNVP